MLAKSEEDKLASFVAARHARDEALTHLIEVRETGGDVDEAERELEKLDEQMAESEQECVKTVGGGNTEQFHTKLGQFETWAG